MPEAYHPSPIRTESILLQNNSIQSMYLEVVGVDVCGEFIITHLLQHDPSVGICGSKSVTSTNKIYLFALTWLDVSISVLHGSSFW